MTSLATVLNGLIAHLGNSAVRDQLLSSVKRRLGENIVLDDPLWVEKEHGAYRSEKFDQEKWSESNRIRNEAEDVKSAFDCFDAIFNFLKSRSSERDRVYFSSRLIIFGSSKDEIQTDGGSTICLRGTDARETAFRKVMAFIEDVRSTFDLKKGFYWDYSTTLALEANLRDDILDMRTEKETAEIVSLGAITLEVLKKVGRTNSDGKYIKVMTKEEQNSLFSENPPESIAYITARWPERKGVVEKAVGELKKAMENEKADLVKLIDDVRGIKITDGARNILLIGKTGAGKSYTGNRILANFEPSCEERFEESKAGSLTSFVECLPSGKSMYKVWDTPGLLDSDGRDVQILDDMERTIYELGSLSAVVLCFGSIERIEGSSKKLFRIYSRLLGPALSERLLVVVNRSDKHVTESQRRALVNTMHAVCGIKLHKDLIFDFGTEKRYVRDQKLSAWKAILRMCVLKPMKIGYMENLSAGLLELESLSNEEEIAEAKETLLKLSERALKKSLTEAEGRYPFVQQMNFGSKLILSNNNVYHDEKSGKSFRIEHVLEIPDFVRSKTISRVKLFLDGLRAKHGVTDVAMKVRGMRLVFADISKIPLKKEQRGFSGLTRKYIYKLYSVDDALSADVRDRLRMTVGEYQKKSVSVFPSIRGKKEENSGNEKPKRR